MYLFGIWFYPCVAVTLLVTLIFWGNSVLRPLARAAWFLISEVYFKLTHKKRAISSALYWKYTKNGIFETIDYFYREFYSEAAGKTTLIMTIIPVTFFWGWYAEFNEGFSDKGFAPYAWAVVIAFLLILKGCFVLESRNCGVRRADMKLFYEEPVETPKQSEKVLPDENKPED